MNTIKIGVIGYGYWGPNLVRNFLDIDKSCLSIICDLNPKRITEVKKRYPAIRTTTNPNDILTDPLINAIAIATPVSTHFDLALSALKAGKHVLVEKPIASTSQQAIQLIEEANKNNLVLMVDHTFVYTGAVCKIKELVAGNALGDIYYYDSVRVNLGLFQHDMNVIWDLAVHDLSIMDYILPLRPKIVSTTGMSHVQGRPENIAYITLFFDNSLIAHIHVNWLAPVKLRRTLISGSKKMIVYDDLEPSEKIKIYDKGVTITNDPEQIHQMLVGYRMGDMQAPQLDMTEALKTETSHFIHCIRTNTCPITDGKAGLRVVQILEAATQSMKELGKPIKLEMLGE